MSLDVFAMEWEDRPALWRAVWDRDFKSAAAMIANGESLDDLIEDGGHTFLNRAAQAGDLDMMDFFLRHGCPVTLETFDDYSHTPLIRAADEGQFEVVRELLAAGANPNTTDEFRIGDTAIFYAVRRGHWEITQLLLNAGADPTIPGWMGLSAVDQAYNGVQGEKNTGLAEKFQRLLMPYLKNKSRKETGSLPGDL